MRYFLILLVLLTACGDEPPLVPSGPRVDMDLPDMDSDILDPDPIDSPILEGTPAPDQRDYQGIVPEAPQGDVEGALYAIGRAFCDRLVGCRTQADVLRFATAYGITNVQTCVEDFLRRNPVAHARGSVDAGRSTLAGNVAPCTSSISQLTCEQLIVGFDSPENTYPACQSVFNGTKGVGESCLSNIECSANHFCDRLLSTNSCEGQCSPLPDFKVYCGDQVCQDDQACDFFTDTCVDLPGVNEPCGPENLCAPNHFCNDEGLCETMTLGFQVGQSCDYATNICALGLYCNIDSTGLGRCQDPVSQGSCNSNSMPSGCDSSSFCNNGSCSPRKATGECEVADECQSRMCIQNTCVDPGVACLP